MSYDLYQLNDEVQLRAQHRSDSIALTSSLRFTERILGFNVGGDLFGDGVDMNCVLNDWAHQQVAGRLGAPPYRWLSDPDKCPGRLHDKIMNWLAQNREPKNVLIRMLGEEGRAVLSDQYTAFDHDSFVPMLIHGVETMAQEAGGNLRHSVIRAYAGDHMRGYILFPDIVMGEDPRGNRNGGSGLHPCMFFSNNEVGRGGVRVHPAVYSGYCSNGAIFGYYAKENALGEGFVRHRWINTDVMTSQVAIAIAGALNVSETIVEAYINSYSERIAEKALGSVVSKWAARFNLTEHQKEVWEENTRSEASMRGSRSITWGDLVNGATVMSHSTVDPYFQDGIEALGGELITELFGLNLYEEVEVESNQRQIELF